MTMQTGNTLLSNSANNHLYANELFLAGEIMDLGVDSIATASPSTANYVSRLIVGTGTGDFAGHNNNIAFYYDSSWVFLAPVNGMRVWVKSLKCYYRYVTSAWQPDSAWLTLTDTTNIVVNAALADNFQVTLAGNRTLSNPSNITGTGLNNDGKIFRFRFVQDGTGNRTITLGTKYKTPGGAGITLSTAAAAIDLAEFIYHQATDTLLYRGLYLDIR